MTKLVTLMFVLIALAGPPASEAQAATAREIAAQYVESYSRAYQIPVELIEAVIEVESSWSPDAISPKGAAGLMQLMPATAARFGVRNRFDIEENIRGGVAYLAWLPAFPRGPASGGSGVLCR